MVAHSARTLGILGFDIDPVAEPLSYPGRTPDTHAALVLGNCLFDVHPARTPVGQWHVAAADGRTLDEVLINTGLAPLDERVPVLAVGSNASPAQLVRKLTGSGRYPAVPITAVRVQGIISGVSAHVSRPGYIPATPVAALGEISNLFVTWLDVAELHIMDATEPNYRRIHLANDYPVHLPDGRTVLDCWGYISRHGCLVDRSGNARRLTTQRRLIAALIRDLPVQTFNLGDPEKFVAAMRSDPQLRDQLRDLIHTEGLAQPQPEFTQ